MAFPLYHVPHSDKRVRIFINGKPVVDSRKQHEHALFINFVGDYPPDITVNKELGTYDIRLPPECKCKDLEKRVKELEKTQGIHDNLWDITNDTFTNYPGSK
jgi:hypothetical protein